MRRRRSRTKSACKDVARRDCASRPSMRQEVAAAVARRQARAASAHEKPTMPRTTKPVRHAEPAEADKAGNAPAKTAQAQVRGSHAMVDNEVAEDSAPRHVRHAASCI